MRFLCRKLLMRWTVLLSDVLIFFPAVIYFVTVYYSGTHDGPKSGNMWHFAMILLNPCLILIDHGHFQVLESMSLVVCDLPLGFWSFCSFDFRFQFLWCSIIVLAWGLLLLLFLQSYLIETFLVLSCSPFLLTINRYYSCLCIFTSKQIWMCALCISFLV